MIMRAIIIVILIFYNASFFSYAQKVIIGNQIWSSKNLDVSTFRNGEQIPRADTDEEWIKAGENKQPAWCYYNNDTANGVSFGKLYNYFAVTDPRGLAPNGWHIPSEIEWTILTKFLSKDVNTRIRSEFGWNGIENGNNISGFNAFPGGFRSHYGFFGYLGDNTYWWCSDEFDELSARNRGTGNNKNIVDTDYANKKNGFSVRCILD
jgi:uncharacterized protein (TIGR02145 family)